MGSVTILFTGALLLIESLVRLEQLLFPVPASPLIAEGLRCVRVASWLWGIVMKRPGRLWGSQAAETQVWLG
jgi:hypothetical protein